MTTVSSIETTPTSGILNDTSPSSNGKSAALEAREFMDLALKQEHWIQEVYKETLRALKTEFSHLVTLDSNQETNKVKCVIATPERAIGW